MEELILKMYFEDKLKQIEIAKILNISKYKVSRIVSKDFEKYSIEKERRKEVNKLCHIEKTKQYISNNRKSKGIDLEYARLKQEHIQATRELSGSGKPISNRAYRDWNTSIYKYNEKNKSYILKRGINVGADVPKRISWKI